MLQISTLFALITMAFAVPSASASSENDVSDCEFVVDDFAVVTSGVYGTSSSELVAQLLVRPDLDQRVVEAGAYFEFSGNYRKLISGPDGSPTPEDWKVDNEQLFIAAQRTIDGQRLKITFPQRWNLNGYDVGERTLKNFTFYVTIRNADGETRYWFKDQGRNLSAEAISPSRYYYSDSVYLGGYSSAKYLWRDSGSPVFSNRAECLSQ
ncbi:MAG: hypothetical protein RI953_2403 [Pseudomonadota bacterium]|jgi:hypothetical protein